jgi:hypothetical protein
VITDASGNASFSLSCASGNTTGQFISATATDASGNTSAFAQDVVCAASAQATIRLLAASNSDSTGSASNAGPFLIGALDSSVLEELASEQTLWSLRRAGKRA